MIRVTFAQILFPLVSAIGNQILKAMEEIYKGEHRESDMSSDEPATFCSRSRAWECSGHTIGHDEGSTGSKPKVCAERLDAKLIYAGNSAQSYVPSVVDIDSPRNEPGHEAGAGDEEKKVVRHGRAGNRNGYKREKGRQSGSRDGHETHAIFIASLEHFGPMAKLRHGDQRM